MNLLQALYCNQYHELKPKGKADLAIKNGTALTTIALVLNLLTIVFLLVLLVPDFADFMEDLMKDIFGRRRGRTIGMLIAGIPFLLLYPAIRFTMGRNASFERLVARFEDLPEARQEAISRRGKLYFFVSLGAIFVPIAGFIIVGM